ncbi:MAG TPA: hypothetical protein VMN76_07030, partial [Acidobacteriota bacterium]|nr:hypothetical protein [Acidobacteriota bacterium]
GMIRPHPILDCSRQKRHLLIIRLYRSTHTIILRNDPDAQFWVLRQSLTDWAKNCRPFGLASGGHFVKIRNEVQ